MAFHRPVRGAAAAVLAAASLGGCASQHIAANVVAYNGASEQAHNKTMLLNVLRASQRRPLEFTALQNITGTSSAESKTELDVPIVQNEAEEALEAFQTLTVSERPTYAVSVLDTQEFYQGVLKPLSTQTFDFYMKRDLSRRMLFDLFFSGVTVKAKTADTRHGSFTAQFDNDVTDDGRFDDFQALTEVLIESGLTTTSIRPRPAVLGPPLTPDEVVKGDFAAKAATGGFALKPAGWCALDDGERDDLATRLNPDPAVVAQLKTACAGRGHQAPDADFLRKAKLPETLYRMEKSAGGANYVLCIQPTGSGLGNQIADDTTCEGLEHRGNTPSDDEGGLNINFDHASPRVCAALNRRRASGDPLDCTGNISMDFTFSARSTYEIIRYLGEVVRRANYPDVGNSARTIMIKSDPGGRVGVDVDLDAAIQAGRPIPTCRADVSPGAALADGAVCLPLFSVLPGRGPADGFVTASYGGRDYYVDVPPLGRSGREPTMEVFQLLTELLALNRSAKDEPATSVFTIVAP
jgi:hypothetical protein